MVETRKREFLDGSRKWNHSEIKLISGVKCGSLVAIHNIMKRSRNVYHLHLKKTRKAEDKIKKNKLLNACLGDGGNIFQEIKDMRRTNTSVASSIDGDKKNIANHFSSIYSRLYNSANDNDETREITEKVENLTTPDKLKDVEAVTSDIIKQAGQKLKPGKSDPSYSFSSDCIKHGPEVFYSILSIIYQGFMIHAYIREAI